MIEELNKKQREWNALTFCFEYVNLKIIIYQVEEKYKLKYI
jgi:hypothetical protein